MAGFADFKNFHQLLHCNMLIPFSILPYLILSFDQSVNGALSCFTINHHPPDLHIETNKHHS